MGDAQRSLRIEEDLAFQRHQSRVERAGWLAMGLLLLAALLGLLGNGWLSVSGKCSLWLDDVPLVLVEGGTALLDRMRKVRVDVDDILAAGRELQGLERTDQITCAVLERSGGIFIIPKSAA